MSATVDVLAIGAHPDDVELGCGATVAKLVAAGRTVGILHLTAGEAGSRGSEAERRGEAERAAAELGVERLDFLSFGDGALRRGVEEEEALVAQLRRLRPELVLGPAPVDRHPDHGRAHRLVADACYYAGLTRRGSGAPHRPAALFAYMQHDPFSPSFVVEVGATWARKMAALDAYASQLTGSAVADSTPSATRASAEPATKVASREFRLAVEGRARYFGQMIGAEFGEPFWSGLPLAVGDPMQLLPGGLR